MNTIKKYFTIIIRQTHPVKFLLSRVLMKTGLSERLLITFPEYSLRFYPTPQLAEMWINPDYSRIEERFIGDYLRKGDIVIDVGANIGLITLRCGKIVGSQGAVHSIEAHPRVFRYLQGNIAVNNLKNVTAYNFGVSNARGTLSFTDKMWDEINSVADQSDIEGVISIPSETLDAIVQISGEIDLLKIDVEGYEKFVFEGAERILQMTQCIFFESNKEHYQHFGYRGIDIYSILRSRKFTILRSVNETTLTEVTDDYESMNTENLIAVRNIQDLLDRTRYSIQ